MARKVGEMGGGATSTIALVSSIVGLAYAIVQGPLQNVGWKRAAKRELELSEMLSEDGAEGEARRMLRERATERIFHARERAESISSVPYRVTSGIIMFALCCSMLACIAHIFSTLLYGPSVLTAVIMMTSLIVAGVGTLGLRIALRAERKKKARIKEMRATDSTDER